MTLLLAAALRATVILGAAWLAARLLHTASADVRHRLWLATICAVASMPALLWLVPTVLPSPNPLVLSAQSSAAESSGARVLSWLRTIWATGALLVLGRLTLGLLSIARISRSAESADGLLYSARIESPMTWGWRRPVVLLPDYARNWSPEQRALLIRHEQAHVERRDWSWQVFAQVVCAIFWFHPLIWVANAALRRESEGAADDQVLAGGAEASTYARQLLAVARHVSHATSLAAVWMTSQSKLERRLGNVLDGNHSRRPATRLVALAIVAAISVVSIPLAAMQGGRIYQVGDEGLTPPRVVSQVKAQYTREAMDAKIQGSVMLELEVSETGLPENIQVTQKLDDGLDMNAVNAVAQWRFAPGRKGGQRVRVQVAVQMTFILK